MRIYTTFRKILLVLTSKWKLRTVTTSGSMPRVFGSIRIVNRGEISIGNRIMFGGRLIPIELVTQNNAYLRIGHETYIHDGSSIFTQSNIHIGDRVLIGRDCLISDSDQHGIAVSKRHEQPLAEPVIIGNDVWLGDRVTVLKGVEIGDGSVIGAGSVVTKNIPFMEIWAGIPASKIGVVEE